MLSEGIDALVNIINDYREALIKLEASDNVKGSALRIYGVEYGNHLIAKRDVPDGTMFQLTVTLNPLDDEQVEVILDSKVVDK